MPSEHLFIWLGLLSLLTFIVSLLTLPWLVAQMPSDYFCHKAREPAGWKRERPVLRALFLIAKNLLGYLLLAGGTVMLFVPGQGLLTMAMGLVLLDYPGKFALERRLVSLPSVFRGLNWLRAKRGAPPLELP
ncbi:MAG: hypothetical protein CMK32_06260 [Porticoccaceae bacterium]|nr:hypothetical protein [Porticoccaceae bacterium]